MRVKTLLCVITCVFLSYLFIQIINYYSTLNVTGIMTEKKEGPYPSDRLEHLFWFIHISDLHFSTYYDPDRKTDFETFCNININVIKPKVVLATGDLTDAKLENLYDSKQSVEEWKIYKEALDRNNVTKKTIWLDIRGNHDTFNVYSVNSSQNFYRTYSIQGQKHLNSYVFDLKNGADKYTFIGIDASLKTGLRRPFNFIGIITQEDYLWLERISKKHHRSNGTIWFGHFPTSTILSSSPGIRHLMRNGLAYFCGHLHTLHDFAPQMQSIHHNGLLELEVGDWKDNRRYRVAAIDHNMLSFVDVKFGEWPIILITNPKHAGYISPNVEPIYRIAKSTHVRILVFSPFNITSVNVNIGLGGSWQRAYSNGHPLYVLPWNPSKYKSGLHNLHVHAIDSAGNKRLQKIVFSVDGSRPDLHFIGKVAIMSHVSWVGVYNNHRNWFKNWITDLQLMTKINCLFYPLMCLIIYPAIGPWFIGSMSEGHFGVVFVWGIFLRNEFIPGSLAFVYLLFQGLFFHLPMVLAISQCVGYKVREPVHTNFSVIIKQNFFFIVALCYQIKMSYSFQASYGSVAAIFSFTYTWYIVLALILWFTAKSLPKYIIIPLHSTSSASLEPQ
ncbi:Transmembrane protein 62 [Nymphon striatum]|nr:Transmembrane protein 62 [Nymphon striatum]